MPTQDIIQNYWFIDFCFDQETGSFRENLDSINRRIYLCTSFDASDIKNIEPRGYIEYKTDSGQPPIQVCKQCVFKFGGRQFLLEFARNCLTVLTDPPINIATAS